MTDDGEAGAVVDGRFELLDPIDSGGLATVWRASDLTTGAPVAVKLESDGVHDREQVRAHFRQELRWFRHFAAGPTPGSLVHFVEGSIEGGRSYLVTELIDGGSIDAYLDETSPGLDALRSVGGPVCRAIAFLHRNGVLHLDLKPGNVLHRRRGPPAVIDLNSAVSSDRETETLFHHDPYKPPELTPTDAREVPAGPWSDVYALGKLLAFLLTGESVAFESSSLADWHAVDPRSHGADCPFGLAAVVERATAPDADERYEDAIALWSSLSPWLDEPDRSALLVHEPSGRRIDVRPGDTVGRWSPDRRVPSVVLPDAERYLSPHHVRLDCVDGDWTLRDQSVNGTYVHANGDWAYLLSRGGRERRAKADAPLPRPLPDASIRLADGDRIAPVSSRSDWALTFRVE